MLLKSGLIALAAEIGGRSLATLPAALGDTLARTELTQVTAMDVVLHHVALISAVNLSA